MSKKVPSKSGQKFSSMQLENALMEAENLMTSLFCDFFLMDDLALFIKENSPDTWLKDLDTITIGVRKHWVTPNVLSTLKTVLPTVEMIPGEWQFEKHGVLVRVTVVERNYHFLRNLDTVPHLSNWFLVPNPFDKYWQARYLVK